GGSISCWRCRSSSSSARRSSPESGPSATGGSDRPRRRVFCHTGRRPSSCRWHMRRALAWPLYAALVFISPLFISALAAQQTGIVFGTVLAAESGAPLPGASVVIVGTARSVFTSDKGEYRLSVAAGTHAVRARLIGYEPAEQRVTVTAGQTVTADFKLTATPLSVNEVVVVGARTSRTATETPVPVDVITAQEMTE